MGKKVFQCFNFIMFEFIGVFIAIVRISEPFVWQEFKIFIKNYIPCKQQKQKSNLRPLKFSDESLCSFMNSAANIEFVYLILLGINNFMDNICKDNEGRSSRL